MNDMTKLLHAHKMIDLDSLWLTNAVYIVASQINQHNMLGTIFFRGKKGCSQSFILCCYDDSKYWTLYKELNANLLVFSPF